MTTESNYNLFWPQDIGPYETDLRCLLSSLEEIEDRSAQVAIVKKQLAQFPLYPNVEGSRLRYRAYLQVLLDLLRQEWQPRCYQGRLYLQPPDWTHEEIRGEDAIRRHKKNIKKSLSWEREAQFEKGAVQEFIRYMERPRSFNNQTISILSLLADGKELAQELESIVNLEGDEEKQQHIVEVIQPYLQLITEDARCIHTGLRLQDIWRYFRYTWATPYNPTPGRQMFYLVRDAKRPFHPIIGIAALGSSMVQLTVRDDVIGWTSDSFEDRILSDDFDDAQAEVVAQMLRQSLVDTLNDIATEDLTTSEEIDSPPDDVVQRLAQIEEKSREQRVVLLQQREESRRNKANPKQMPLGVKFSDNGSVDPDELAEQAQQALFRAKRANVLNRMLSARMAMQDVEQAITTRDGLRAFWATDDGQKAVRDLIKENKKRRIGINMMDIIVCGAIEPYGALLGGKLVAMLLASSQVVHDYKQKYEGYASKIASRMKGEPVQRDPELVFLGTTSLYSVGSSQYNRISIPVPNHSDAKIRYIKYGLTKGFGSVHFSEETMQCLVELQEFTHKARLINNRFGEGVNPKLRRVSAGLASIGLTAVDRFLRHRSQRIVYGVPLGRKTYAFLRGETEDADYYFDVDSANAVEEGTRYVARYWATRWLLKRIQKKKHLLHVASFDKETFLLSREFQEELPRQQAMNV